MSSNESTYVRELAEGEPTEPTWAAIATADGRWVACTVRRKDESTWIAEAQEPHLRQEGDRFLIDRLPAGGAMEFWNVFGPGEQEWSGRAAPHPAT